MFADNDNKPSPLLISGLDDEDDKDDSSPSLSDYHYSDDIMNDNTSADNKYSKLSINIVITITSKLGT